MRKIPTLFIIDYTENKHRGKITTQVREGFEWVLDGEGIATVKKDGTACAIIDGKFYRRYDAKIGKNGKRKEPPANSIPCQEKPDEVTGHMPYWTPVLEDDKSAKWHYQAYLNSKATEDATYEAVGPHFQGNPYNLPEDTLLKHGAEVIDLKDRSFEGIKEYLRTNYIEGIVFWKDGKPQCKIRRKDFGFDWNKPENRK